MKSEVRYCSTSGKVQYDKKTAQTAANKRYADDHVELRIYQCPSCNWWHLTHTNIRPKNKRHRHG